MIEADYSVEFKPASTIIKLPQLADFIANYTATMAKVYAPERTGRLRSSISVDPQRSVSTPFEEIRYVVAKAPYAAVVEYGRTKYKPFPGRFYMKQAVEATERFIQLYVTKMTEDMGLTPGGE